MRLQIIGLCLACLCLLSCATTSTNQSPLKTTRSRISPMVYDGWQIRDFQYIGLKVDLPKQAHDSPSAKGPATVSFSMHYLSPPLGIVDDATVFVHIYVDRIPFAALAEKLASVQKSSLYKQSTEEENKVWIWRYTFLPTSTRWDEEGTYSYFRRDVKLNDTEILHVYAEVLNAGPQESRDADHAAVQRILDSIQPLNVTPTK